MKLVVEPEAASWYKRAMDLADGACLRIYVRLGGCGSVHPGLSLGIMEDVPRSPGLRTNVEGIEFYIEEENLWYLEQKDLRIAFDAQDEEIRMTVDEPS
ncbi:HesB/YadR/YfhF family protein [Paenibacillus sp. GCM10027626]|uniref:HesB/YadR/YfhF family protein n=1 Tax=Paenibacillus sp. GCM10027626 TaxID=3273411 RepID=UPI003633D32A